MKKLLLALFLFIPLVSALQFSPTSLHFNLDQNEVSCQDIYIETESPITSIEDFWAKEGIEDWSLDFNTSAAAHDLYVNYPPEAEQASQIPVCISGSEAGKYRGVLIIRQEEIGNSMTQIAIWLDVTITGEEKTTQTYKKPSGSYSPREFYVSIKNNSQATQNSLKPISYEPQENIQLQSKKADAERTSLAPIVILATLPVILIIIFLAIFLPRK